MSGRQTVTYCSKLLTAGQVKRISQSTKALIVKGQELEANILILRYASKRKRI